ncbi:MAG TPA: lipid-binding SYLF domain-containing protein [Candidatus Saccharimonadales bacterium]|nr:lipid-binding SYLF domain-containing protein [Candidatus Saccharimonadales bacterium]
MRKLSSFLRSILLAVLPILVETASASNLTTDDNRLKNCGTVLKSVLDISDDIPQDLLDRSDCVVVIPNVLRATRIDGGSYGRGAMTCRQGEDFNGPWGAPTMMFLEGGNFGYQIDRKSTDLILLVMNEAGANALLGSEVKLGADATSAAGPVGHELATESCEVQQAEILSYSRARGMFAGASLAGTTIRPDNGNNHRLYGRKIPARDITLSGTVAALPAAGEMISTLETKTPKHSP